MQGDYYAAAAIAGAPHPPDAVVQRAITVQGLTSIMAGVWGTASGERGALRRRTSSSHVFFPCPGLFWHQRSAVSGTEDACACPHAVCTTGRAAAAEPAGSPDSPSETPPCRHNGVQRKPGGNAADGRGQPARDPGGSCRHAPGGLHRQIVGASARWGRGGGVHLHCALRGGVVVLRACARRPPPPPGCHAHLRVLPPARSSLRRQQQQASHVPWPACCALPARRD